MPRIGSGQYKCGFNGCGRSFSRRYNLRAHWRMHSGEEPYICQVNNCGMNFMWRSGLSNHMRRSHNGMKLPSRRKAPAEVDQPTESMSSVTSKDSSDDAFHEQLESIWRSSLGTFIERGPDSSSPSTNLEMYKIADGGVEQAADPSTISSFSTQPSHEELRLDATSSELPLFMSLQPSELSSTLESYSSPVADEDSANGCVDFALSDPLSFDLFSEI
mmetsp:Transcript_1826/g.5516  ORF Transcript_1826/g.5516 Transcript_1826/m.5516 type:complete len:217 (-) Transcript_1826:40-690(-)